MRLPSWTFALLRIGVLALLYIKFDPRFGSLYSLPVLFYGLPLVGVLAALGVHRYIMFVLGAMVLSFGVANLYPKVLMMDTIPGLALGMVIFLLGFTPCDRDYSIRALWNRQNKTFFNFHADPRGLWILYSATVFTLYFSHLIKRTNPNYFQGNFIGRNLITQFWGADFIFANWFPPFTVAVSILLWSLNLALCVMVWVPRFYKPFLITSVIFNGLLLYILPARDLAHLLLLMLSIPFAGYLLAQMESSKVLTTT